MVYHLQVEANSTKYGDLIEHYSCISEVYSTMKKAVEEGKEWLNKRLKKLYEDSNYCTNDECSLTLEDMLNDNAVQYSFRVIELDPLYADNFEIPNREYKCKELKPTHVTHYFDIKGNLQFKELEYKEKDGGFSYSIMRYPRR